MNGCIFICFTSIRGLMYAWLEAILVFHLKSITTNQSYFFCPNYLKTFSQMRDCFIHFDTKQKDASDSHARTTNNI